MKSRFQAIALRRAVLVEDIATGRESLALAMLGLRKELAWAGLGLMVSQLLVRKRWLSIAGLATLAISLGGPLLAHFFPAPR